MTEDFELHGKNMRIKKTIAAALLALLSLPALSQVRIDSTEVARILYGVPAVATTGEDSTETDSTILEFATDPGLTWQQNIIQRLDGIMQSSLLETVNVGLMVWDLTDGTCLYKFRERSHLRPASTMKCITAIAALDRLGDNHRFTTRLCYTGEVVDSTQTLNGDLYCVGGMDPMFGNGDMAAFASAVRQLGITTLNGNIYADLSFKDRDRLGYGWCWDDDNPTLSPLLVGRKDNFAEQLRRHLRNAGITVSGETGERQLPSTALHLTSCSHTIGEVMQRMMKKSDNLYAEAMFYQIAAAEGTKWASYKQARQYIHTLVRKLGLSPADCIVADGSGLSLYNYVSAELEVKLLNYAYHTPSIYYTFLPTLPVAGVDGTLRNRMRHTPAAGNVRAKTGTVVGVSSLAGYLTASNGHRLSFSIICNGGLSNAPMRNLQNNICVALCQ